MRKLFKGGNFSREETIREKTVTTLDFGLDVVILRNPKTNKCSTTNGSPLNFHHTVTPYIFCQFNCKEFALAELITTQLPGRLFSPSDKFEERNFKLIQRGDPYEKSVLLELRKHTLIFCVVVIGTHTN